MQLGVWHHYAILFDGVTLGPGTATVFLDGEEATSINISDGVGAGENEYAVLNGFVPEKPWNGAVDELRLLARLVTTEELMSYLEWHIMLWE